MNENAVRTSLNISQIANELCELYQLQIDTLQQGTLAGLAETELKQYRAEKGGFRNCADCWRP
jgi:hypothetical protein